VETFESLQGFVADNLSLLADVDTAWQPTDFLPNLQGEDWSEQIRAFRATADTLPDDLLVILVGNMVTEEALPSYAIRLEHVAHDVTGCDDSPWAKWLRGWTSEENRHGDLLNAYLRLTGRVDMRSVEQTIHRLIRDGFNPRTHGDKSSGLIYAAFQERATRITHGNVGRLALQHGDENLAKICRKIAADETRHETFYTRTVGKMLEQEPEPVILSLRKVLRGLIAMPGSKMFDGHDPDLFDHFATVSQRMGTYTVRDYAAIIKHLVEAWKLGDLSLTGAAAKAQDYLCRQPERYENLADQIAPALADQPLRPFQWIHGRVA
jgi:acyl-[acyl-carrier-protein] desaturase